MQATILYLCYISTEIFVPDLSYHRRRKYINQHQNTMNMKKFYLFLFIALAWTISASAQVPAFPGADGYGRYTTGGRGGLLCNLARRYRYAGNPPLWCNPPFQSNDTVQSIGNHTTQQQPEYPRQ